MSILGADEQLFKPLKLGRRKLKHRIVMAPATHDLPLPEHIPNSSLVEYYRQRASKGGLIISEGVHISERAGNTPNTPRIDFPRAVEGWRKVCEAIHNEGGLVSIQLDHIGRCALPIHMNNQLPLSSSAVPLTTRPLSLHGEHVAPVKMEFSDLVYVRQEFIIAARHAIDAGADFVEVNMGNGHLMDQFFNDNVNIRDDRYGGASGIEDRARLPLHIIGAIAKEIGAEKVAVRLTPYGRMNEMRDSDPLNNWRFICAELDKLGLAYIHLVDPSVYQNDHEWDPDSRPVSRSSSPAPISRSSTSLSLSSQWNAMRKKREDAPSVEPFLEVINNTAVIMDGGWDEDTCNGIVTENSTVVALSFGELFKANPDLPKRLKNGFPLSSPMDHFKDSDRDFFRTNSDVFRARTFHVF